MQRDKTFAIIQRLPPDRTKPYYSKPKWRLQRSKIAETQKMHYFSLLIPKPIFGARNHFLSIFSIFEHYCAFCSKWLKMASCGPMKHRPGAFWPQNWLSEPKVVKKFRIMKMVPFSIPDLKSWFLLIFSIIALGEAACEKQWKTLLNMKTLGSQNHEKLILVSF